MKEFNSVKKVCGFYISNMHLATMILPYTNKQLEEGIKFATLLEYNLKQNIELILSRLTLNEESNTLEDVCEPYLMQMGFLSRTPRGRICTDFAYEHLGITKKEGK